MASLMARWAARVGAMVALTIAGCGGDGGGGPTSPTQSTAAVDPAQVRAAVSDYRAQLQAFAQRLQGAGDDARRLARAAGDPPRLRRLDSQDPAYVAARATAATVATTAGELGIIAGEPEKRAARLYYQQYDIGGDHWSEAFEVDKKRYDRLAAILYADDGGFAHTSRRDEREVQRIWRRAGAQEIALFERARRRMERLATRNAIERSTIDYALDEYDRSIALWREFRRQMREPVDRDQIGWYTAIVSSQDGYHTAGAAITRARDRLLRGFVRTIRRLAAGQAAAPGDAYRAAIVAGFVSPLKRDKARDSKITDRGWMLFRIRQLEDTPQQAYEEARATLQLENIDDARNAYTDALEVYQQKDAAAEPEGNRLPGMRDYQAWAREKLARTFPPLLQPMVQRMDALIQRYPTRADWESILRLNRQIERALHQGAKAADDPRRLKAALRDALDATRTAGAAPSASES